MNANRYDPPDERQEEVAEERWEERQEEIEVTAVYEE